MCPLRTQSKPRLCLKILSSSFPVMLLHFVNCLLIPLTLLVNVRWKKTNVINVFPCRSRHGFVCYYTFVSIFFKVNMHAFLYDFVSPFCLYNGCLLHGLVFFSFPHLSFCDLSCCCKICKHLLPVHLMLVIAYLGIIVIFSVALM